MTFVLPVSAIAASAASVVRAAIPTGRRALHGAASKAGAAIPGARVGIPTGHSALHGVASKAEAAIPGARVGIPTGHSALHGVASKAGAAIPGARVGSGLGQQRMFHGMTGSAPNAGGSVNHIGSATKSAAHTSRLFARNITLAGIPPAHPYGMSPTLPYGRQVLPSPDQAPVPRLTRIASQSTQSLQDDKLGFSMGAIILRRQVATAMNSGLLNPKNGSLEPHQLRIIRQQFAEPMPLVVNTIFDIQAAQALDTPESNYNQNGVVESRIKTDNTLTREVQALGDKIGVVREVDFTSDGNARLGDAIVTIDIDEKTSSYRVSLDDGSDQRFDANFKTPTIYVPGTNMETPSTSQFMTILRHFGSQPKDTQQAIVQHGWDMFVDISITGARATWHSTAENWASGNIFAS